MLRARFSCGTSIFLTYAAPFEWRRISRSSIGSTLCGWMSGRDEAT